MNNIIPCVSRLFIYPIKTLDGVEVESAKVLKSGALQFDREFAIFDESGSFINGKRNARVHAIRSRFDLNNNTVTVSAPLFDEATFHIESEHEALLNILKKKNLIQF